MLSLIPRFSPWPVPRPVLGNVPGPQVLAEGDLNQGWYGEVDAGELISGTALASKIGLTAGTDFNADAGWLKFSHLGKTLFIAKRPFRHSVSRDQLLAANAITGSRLVTIGDHIYKLRLVSGASSNPSQNNNGVDAAGSHGSEWNRLMYHVCAGTQQDVFASEGGNRAWETYSVVDLGLSTPPGSFTICRETHGANPSYVVCRGFGGGAAGTVSYFGYTTFTDTASRMGWRPVLEYVGPVIVGYDPNLWLQYSFLDNEPINEVTETFALLANNAAITNRALVTGTTAADNMRSSPILFDANEDFTVELMFNCSTYSVNMPLLGIVGGTGSGVSKNAWYLVYDQPTGAFSFIMYGSTLVETVTFVRPAIRGADAHIAAERYNGTLTLYIDGVPVASAPSTQGNAPTSLFMDTSFTSTYFSGTRKNFRITKGKAQYTAAFTPPTELPAVGRPTYDQETSDAIRVQMDLRRDNAVNEVFGQGVQMNGTARVANGAITHTGSNSSFYITRMEPFGQGDFTVELQFNLSAINATYGALLAGQWHYGPQANNNNCWYLHTQSTRLLSFGIANSGAAGDYGGAVSSTAFVLGVDNHVVVERIAGVLTMYLNGVQVAQANNNTPIRTVEPVHVRSNSAASFYAFAGKVWNLRIADTPLYNGEVKLQPQFPKLLPSTQYAPEVLDDIAVQVSLRKGNPRNEKTGQNIIPSGTATVQRDGISTTLVATSKYQIPTPHFGDADFTIEMKLTMISSSGASTRPFFGQFRGGATNNSWIFYTLGTNIAFQGNDQLGGSVTLNSTAAGFTWVAGVEYHVVVERVGSTVSMYIDGVLMQSGTLEGPLVNMDAFPYITNIYEEAATKFCSTKVRDIRVAKRALFNGVINKLPFPEIPNQKPSLMMTSTTSPTMHGAAQNLDYLGGIASGGMFSHTLFRDIRDPQNIKTVRLVALVNERSYTVLAYRPSDIPPTPDMPVFTNSLKIGESTVTLSTAPGASVKAGAIGLYWNGNLLGANAHGRCIPFEFL